jgi:hypothetical protein
VNARASEGHASFIWRVGVRRARNRLDFRSIARLEGGGGAIFINFLFEVPTSLTMRSTVFWDTIPCNTAKVC